MELDTPRNGAKAGQELELKYISTADFDFCISTRLRNAYRNS